MYVQYIYFFIFLQDEYNLNPGLEWEDEFTGRYRPAARTKILSSDGIDMKQNRNVPILTLQAKRNQIKSTEQKRKESALKIETIGVSVEK